MRTKGRRWIAAVASLCIGAVIFVGNVPPATAGVSGARAVELLNAQRSAHGIPAGIAHRSDWSAACELHNRYMSETGTIEHDEDPSSPWYTEDGDWAAENSVLYWGPPVWEQRNPWEDAPIHLAQLLGPGLSEMGAAESHERGCATTWEGYKRAQPAQPTAYSYPGDGASRVPVSQRAEESPFVPGDFVGLPASSLTGPYLMVFVHGAPGWITGGDEAETHLTSASMTGPSGPIPIRTVDSRHPEVGPFVPNAMAFLIPTQPLTPDTRYRVTATFSDPAITHAFAFDTEPPQDLAAPETIKRGGPGKRIRRRSATFSFSSEPGATFTCSLDARPYQPCSSPARVTGLKKGRHRFRAVATDQAGNIDPTPATWSFRVA